MPYTIKKQGEVYRLWNRDKKSYAKPKFKTRQAAVNSKNNYEKYDKRYNKKK